MLEMLLTVYLYLRIYVYKCQIFTRAFVPQLLSRPRSSLGRRGGFYGRFGLRGAEKTIKRLSHDKFESENIWLVTFLGFSGEP